MITRFGQAAPLAHQVRPAAQAVFPGAIDPVTVTDQQAVIAVVPGVLLPFPAARADADEDGAGDDQSPLSPQHTGFWPRCFVHIQWCCLHEAGHPGILQRQTGTPGFADCRVDHAGARRQIEHFPQ